MSKTFYIVGANFINKGAESMMFSVSSEIKKRDIENSIIVFPSIKTTIDQNKYLFKICEKLNLFDYMYILGGVYKVLAIFGSKLKKLPIHRKNIDELKKEGVLLDISGFAFSSKWGFSVSLQYLFRILAFNKKGINIVLMPQSFGPFNYGGIKQKIVDYYAKKALPLCKKIYAREDDGYNLLLNKYKLKNVSKSLDLVLQTKSVDYNLILNDFKAIDKDRFNIKSNSVAIIPNVRVLERIKKFDCIELYKKAIELLLELNKDVYLISHSTEDIDICKKIKAIFDNNEHVHLIDDELSSIEYSLVVSKFDFIIASRFHSIVHAYKENVPAITIGWAIKYYELMKYFKQEQYCLDITDLINESKIIDLIKDMNQNYAENKDLLKKGLVKAQEHTCFDILDELK